ncbi:amidohydrolase/deacetylase family metallohydrolase [Parapedobacter lycopersici]|uniref:amidohydrolase/deacetylase family metallohydrolase n=1 Tax=Parapedobacter lycopersici TaxID=1864939 RepID=UPI00214D9080|nr:amidohydrolase/deacetylase family metallohydrolase [Parapedobacter lycopersici]
MNNTDFKPRVLRFLIALNCWLVTLSCPMLLFGQSYDLLIKGGHVIDPKNGRDGVMDVAVAGDTIALVAADIPAGDAKKVIDANGLLVTPGLINIHTHVFVGSEAGQFANGISSVSPDDFTFRSGITTVVDAGTSGWRSFPLFKKQVIDQVQTRVLAFLNIAGAGMVGSPGEQDLQDMNAWLTSTRIKDYSDVIVGVKIGHYLGTDWTPFDRALEAASLAGVPLFVECHLPEYTLEDQLKKMRPGDIITHTYEQVSERMPITDEQGKVRPFVLEARKRGVLFDVGHGGAGFWFNQAIPAVRQGFYPDAFGMDLHRFSMNSGMKDMLNIMSKFLAMGMPLDEIIPAATWGAATAIKRDDLGNLDVGAPADIAVLRIREGDFGFMDSARETLRGTRKFEAEITVRAGRIVWDLNGISGKWIDAPAN